MFKTCSFLLKIKTVAHKLLACESRKERRVRIYCHETPEKKNMPDYPTIINPNLLKDANHCTLIHRDEILRGPPCSKSLNQALDHQV